MPEIAPLVADEHAPAVDTRTPTLEQAFAAARAEHSPAEEPDQPTQDTEAAPASDVAANPEPSLISDEEYAQLEATHRGDPIALRKELNRVFTQKTQALAATRKAVEPYAAFIEEYEADPAGTARKLAIQHGLSLAASPVAETPAQSAVDDAVASFRTALGPDLGFLADKLAPAVQQMAERVAASVMESTVGPLRDQQGEVISHLAQEQTNAVMQSFGQKHPDWQQHEPKMIELGAKLLPNGMEELEYLDLLYTLATKDQAVAQSTKRAVVRMSEAAARAEGKSAPLPESRINQSVSKTMTIREAYEASKRELAARGA